MTTGYCEKCGQAVLTKREDIDVCLAIILAIFTAGIGLIIYLIIWASKEENRCVHCNSIVKPILTQSSQVNYDTTNVIEDTKKRLKNPYKSQKAAKNTQDDKEVVEVFGDKLRYCPFCGKKIEDEEAEYCADCGGSLS